MSPGPQKRAASNGAEQPAVSVVIPFYNAERFLPACLSALRRQSVDRDSFEIVLVNNNSTDDSVRFAAEQDDVILLHQPAVGSYAARNMGILHARGDIIATLDPDCEAAPQWIAEIMEGMRDPECEVLLGNQRHAGSSDGLFLLELYEAEKVEYVTTRRDKKLYFGYTNNMAFRRSLFDRIGLFPERIRGGDTVFVARVVDQFGCDAVCYRGSMKTTHLELDTVNSYYSKRAIYGKSNERLSQSVAFRPLRNSERLRIVRNLIRKNKVPLKKIALLALLLAPGVILYEGARWVEVVKRRINGAGS